MGDLVGLPPKTGLRLKTHFLKQPLQKKYQKNHRNHSSPSGAAPLLLFIKGITTESYQIPVKLFNRELTLILPYREKGSESLLSKMIWLKASIKNSI